MKKRAISVTLQPDNVLWLEARTRATGSGSLSAILNAVISEARRASAAPRSIRGRVRFADGQTGLQQGEEEIRRAFDSSLARRHSSPRRRG